MKKMTAVWFRVCLGLLLFACAWPSCLAQSTSISHKPHSSRLALMSAEWMRAKDWTSKYIDAMPEENFEFKPVPEVRSFSEQMLHLAYWNYGFNAKVFGKPAPFSEEQLMTGKFKTKAVLSKVVAESYDFVINGLKSLTEEQLELQLTMRPGIVQTRAQRISDSYEHQTHHRGQTVLYLRLKGVVPPPEPF